jgi:hypothetical protein
MVVEARLNGFFPPDFKGEPPVAMRIGAPPAETESRTVPIGDARRLQSGALSERDFFDEHGFVLLGHRSAVSDWETAAGSPEPSDVAIHYLPEIEAVLRERLLPGRKIEIMQRPDPLRRGRGTATPSYGDGVHQDFGLTPDDYQTNVEAFASPEAGKWWRAGYERDEVEGYMMVDFWRTTNMAGPLRHMPLALLDPASVEMADVVPTLLSGVAPNGKATSALSLRFDPGQSWYFYPDMTGEEMLAFKIFERWKEGGDARLRTCFHSAFRDPGAPADAEERQSCEHRVGVFFLRD